LTLTKKEIENLKRSIFQLSIRDENNLFSFIKGFTKGKGENYYGIKIIRKYLYDKNIKTPSWELFYKSKNDFKNIRFYALNMEGYQSILYTYDNVHRLLADISDTVKYILKADNYIYLFTSIFLPVFLKLDLNLIPFRIMKFAY